MKVYTKTGDNGTTSLIGGKRVPKNHPRVEAYGDADELISYLGLLLSSLKKRDIPNAKSGYIRNSILRIQKVLMFVSAYFATPAEGAKKTIKDPSEEEIQWLENEIDKMTEEMPPLKAFVLPGAPIQAAYCHVARTICRRCERRCIGIIDSESDVSGEGAETAAANADFGRRYLNRLSDYLFTLARYFCFITETPEEFWLP